MLELWSHVCAGAVSSSGKGAHVVIGTGTWSVRRNEERVGVGVRDTAPLCVVDVCP